MAEKPVFDIDFSDPEVAAAIKKAQEAEGATAPKTSSGGLVPDWMQYLAGGAVRAAGPLVGRVVMGGLGALGGGAATGGPGAIPGGIAGVMAGGALGSGLVEPIAEMIEPGTHKLTDVSPARVATEAAIGAVPLPFTSKLKKPVESFIRGAALETGANVARKVAAGQELSEAANPANWGPLDYLSPALGGAFSSYLSKYPHTPGPASAKPTPPPVPQPAPHYTAVHPATMDLIIRKVKEGLPLTEKETAIYKSAAKDALASFPPEVQSQASNEATRKLVKIENEQRARRYADLDQEQIAKFADDPLMKDLAADEASEAAAAELVKKQAARNTKKFRNRMKRENAKEAAAELEQRRREAGLEPGPTTGSDTITTVDPVTGERKTVTTTWNTPPDGETGEALPSAPVPGGKPPLAPKTPSGGVAVTPEIAALIGEEPPVPPVVEPEAPPAPTRTPEQVQYQDFVDKIAKLQSDLEAADTPLKKQLIQSLIDQQTKAMNEFVARMKTPPTAATPAVEPVAPVVDPSAPTPPAPTGKGKGKGRAGKAASTAPAAAGTAPATEGTPPAAPRQGRPDWDNMTLEQVIEENLRNVPKEAQTEEVLAAARATAERSAVLGAAKKALAAGIEKGVTGKALKKLEVAVNKAGAAAHEAGENLRTLTAGKALAKQTPPSAPAAPLKLTPEQEQAAETLKQFLGERSEGDIIRAHSGVRKYVKDTYGLDVGDSKVRGAFTAKVLPGHSVGKGAGARVLYRKEDVDNWVRANTPSGRIPGTGGFRRGERGSTPIDTLLRLALATGGALTGAAADREHPMEGAVLGGLAGAVAPSAARQLSRLTRTLPAGATAAQKARAVAGTAWEEAPNYQRFALLAEPTGLAINTAAPIGSSVMGAIERLALGDKRGAGLIGELMNTPAMAESVRPAFQRSMRGIDQNIGRVDMDFGGRTLGPVETVMSYPAAIMTTGDVVAQEAGARAGIEPAIMRAMTLTNEPKMIPFQGLANIGRGKGADLLKLLLPFKRTALNVVESGVERTPLLGFAAMNPNWMKDPADAVKFREAITRQGLGAGVFFVSKRIGEQTDPENAKFYRKLVSNMAGQYGALAAAGFAAGQAEAMGLNPEEGWFDENIGSSGHILQSLIADLPVPTPRLLKEAGTGAANLIQQGVPFPEREGVAGKWVPRSFIPGFLKDLVDEEGTIDSETADALIRQYLQELQGEEEADDSIR